MRKLWPYLVCQEITTTQPIRTKLHNTNGREGVREEGANGGRGGGGEGQIGREPASSSLGTGRERYNMSFN